MKPLVDRWASAFMRLHPLLHCALDLQGTATGQFGLQMDRADIAASERPIYPYEYYGIYRRSQLLTIEIPVATGSCIEPGRSTALGVYVHRDNPLSKLSLPQLDRIFGAERAGGWQGMEWNTAVARGPDSNIRAWGQLGLGGALAAAPIIPFGPPLVHPGGVSFFQGRVMGGADVWNERLQEFPDRAAMLEALGRERTGIGYATLGPMPPGVKILALAEADGAPAFAPTPRTVASRDYPLARYGYFYLAPDSVTGDPQPIRPEVAAFLQFVLGPTGQRLVTGTGYFPLPASSAAAQLGAVGGPHLTTSSGSEGGA